MNERGTPLSSPQLENTDIELWMFYVKFVVTNVLKGPEGALEALRSRPEPAGAVDLTAARDAVLNARAEVTRAFELAINKVGTSIDASKLWREYIAFLKRAPVCTSPYTVARCCLAAVSRRRLARPPLPPLSHSR